MSSLRRTAGPRAELSKRIQRWPLFSTVIVILIVALIVASPVRAQPFFEIVQRSQVDQTLVSAAAQATLYSLASLARLGTPFAFWEAPADLHKLKVLDERRIINLEGYARTSVAPRAQRARRNLPAFSIQQRSISAPDAQTLGDYYAIATALGLYMFEHGGRPKVIRLYAPGEAPFVTRFETTYGKRLQKFEEEFFGWLDRK
jgi:hypothetical protein